MTRFALPLFLIACGKSEPNTDQDADTDTDTDTDSDTDTDTDPTTDTGTPLPRFESALVINEVVNSNLTGLQDVSLAFPDWVEIWNSGATDVSLASHYLTDGHALLTRFAFSSLTVIPAGGYLIVMCDGDLLDSTPDELHANFSLKSGGEWVALTRKDPKGLGLVDEVDVPEPGTDVSYARQPDGGAFVNDTTPTPGATNE